MALPTSLIESKICRVCLTTDTVMFCIYDHKCTDENISVAAMIGECTKYKVAQSDGLPQLICNSCLKALDGAFKFKRKCEKNYKIFVGLLANIKVQTAPNHCIEKSTQTDEATIYSSERYTDKLVSSEELTLHSDKMDKNGAVNCRFCSKTFNRIRYLKTHIAVLHPEFGFFSDNECNICSEKFTCKEHVRRHLAVVHKVVEENFKLAAENTFELKPRIGIKENFAYVDYMDKTVAIKTDLDNHDIIDNETDYENAEDEQIFNEVTFADSIKKDKKSVGNIINTTSSSGFMAVLLNETSGTEELADHSEEFDGGFNIHLESFDDDTVPKVLKRRRGRPPKKAFTASPKKLAQSSFNNCHEHIDEKTVMENNEFRELGNGDLTCEICSESYPNICLLKEHIQKRHKMDIPIEYEDCDKLYKCVRCSKKFTTKIYLQRHLARHESKRYVCKECSENFETKPDLQAHIKAEGHDKPLLCPECGLRCKTNNILMVHMRRHNGEKPYKCKFCSKGFPRMDDLRVHEKYHTGEKSHFCGTCGKGFQRKYNLTIHLRVHTGEKPYKCPHCTQAFAQGNDLKSHIRRHTGERFRCELCDAAFLQGYQIRQHKLTEHGIKEAAPTQRVAKFTSPEEQEHQIKQILAKEKM